MFNKLKDKTIRKYGFEHPVTLLIFKIFRSRWKWEQQELLDVWMI